MAHDRDNLPSEQVMGFEELLSESRTLLEELREEITNGAGILAPETQKKQELYVRLDLIMKQLNKQRECLHEEEKQASLSASSLNENDSPGIKIENIKIKAAKEKLISILQHLKGIIKTVASLTSQTEDTCKKQMQAFSREMEDINKNILAILQAYERMKTHTFYITKLEYGKDLATYATFGAAALKAILTIGLAWFDTFSAAAKTAGTIFYPISAAFTTLTDLFRLLSRATQLLIITSTETNRQETDELRSIELENTKAFLSKSIMRLSLLFSLNLLSTLAFAGVFFSTPIGWILVAAATFMNWYENEFSASQKSNDLLEKFETEHEEVLINRKNADPTILKQHETLKKQANDARAESRWGFANMIAMALIACGPIPFAGPFIGLSGLAIFAVVSMRNIYVAAKPYVEKYFAAEEPKQGVSKEEASSSEKKHEHTIEASSKPAEEQAAALAKTLKNPAERKGESKNIHEISEDKAQINQNLNPSSGITEGQARIIELLAKKSFIFSPPSNDPVITTAEAETKLSSKTRKNSRPSSGQI